MGFQFYHWAQSVLQGRGKLNRSRTGATGEESEDSIQDDGSKSRKVQHKAFVAQSCPTLCDSTDHRPPGLSIHGILQARILEWVAISFSN